MGRKSLWRWVMVLGVLGMGSLGAIAVLDTETREYIWGHLSNERTIVSVPLGVIIEEASMKEEYSGRVFKPYQKEPRRVVWKEGDYEPYEIQLGVRGLGGKGKQTITIRLMRFSNWNRYEVIIIDRQKWELRVQERAVNYAEKSVSMEINDIP